jgi:hypothetical protein
MATKDGTIFGSSNPNHGVAAPPLQNGLTLERSQSVRSSSDHFQSGSSPSKKTVPPSADFRIESHGSVVLLIPQTTSGRLFVEDQIGRNNGYQPYWPIVCVEHRFIADIVEGIRNDGLAVSQ